MKALRQAALALAAKGMRIFPCVERGKEPAIHSNLKRATTDPNVISGWWRRYELNIAIATGPGSGIWVLDVDGDEGETTLRKLEAAQGALPPTVEVITGDGRHVYFRWPQGCDIRNSQCRDDVPGLDWRGNGGYAVAPPSVHPSGRRYAWSVDRADSFADAPDWLVELVTSKSRSDSVSIPASTPEQWATFLAQRVDGSRRGSAIARFAGLLLRKYLDPLIVLDTVRMFNALRCDPPLADEEIVRIVVSIGSREADRREQRR